MNKQGRFKMRKILNIVSSINFFQKSRHRLKNEDRSLDDDHQAKLLTESSRYSVSDSRCEGTFRDGGVYPRRSLCEVANCEREVAMESVPYETSDIRRKSSAGSSATVSTYDALRRDSRGSQFENEVENVKLTDDQKAELKQAFSMFEKAGKGRILARDLGELLRCLGWNPSEQDLEEARHEFELTARGSLSFSEVEAYIARRGGICHENNAEEDIMVAFQVLDKNGSGRITVSDFRRFLTTMGERMSQDEVEELISRSAQDGRDYIEYTDIVLAIQHLSEWQ